MIRTDEETKLSTECIDDIKNYTCPYRQEQYMEELIERYLYRKEKQRREKNDKEFYQDAREEYWSERLKEEDDWYRSFKKKELLEIPREELTEMIIDHIEYDMDHNDYIDFIVNIYIND